ncbi:hypothetical protein VUR80DRAFT_5414 [Thermomyces stellatus]
MQANCRFWRLGPAAELAPSSRPTIPTLSPIHATPPPVFPKPFFDRLHHHLGSRLSAPLSPPFSRHHLQDDERGNGNMPEGPKASGAVFAFGGELAQDPRLSSPPNDWGQLKGIVRRLFVSREVRGGPMERPGGGSSDSCYPIAAAGMLGDKKGGEGRKCMISSRRFPVAISSGAEARFPPPFPHPSLAPKRCVAKLLKMGEVSAAGSTPIRPALSHLFGAAEAPGRSKAWLDTASMSPHIPAGSGGVAMGTPE